MQETHRPSELRNYIKIARPDHWIKNLFLLPGSFFAFFLTSQHMPWEKAAPLLIGLAATCLIASANYVINEWLDADFDRFHPTKKFRPFVTEQMSVRFLLLEYCLLCAGGLLLSARINRCFLTAELVLLAMGLLYNVRPLRLKDLPYLDVLTESVNNALRFYLGWFIITDRYYPPVSIILGFWFGGAFLMAVKRFSEYRMIADPALAGKYRKSFLHYSEKSLLISSFFYAMFSVFFLGVFLVKYRIELLLAVPFLCGLFCLYFSIGLKKDSAAQKPEKLFREKFLMLYLVCFLVLVVVLLFVNIPQLSVFLSDSLIEVS
ncbi:UbiA prenyltransferase family protein [Caproicibacter sp. BJN0012]